jgi:N-acetylmuramoyl-L-alanine amidase
VALRWFFWRPIWLGCLLLTLIACDEPGSRSPRVDTGGVEPLSLETRDQLLSFVSELEAEGERSANGAERSASFARAAHLLEQSYLRDGKTVDAVRAEDLWKRASAAAPGSCETALRGLRLSAFLSGSSEQISLGLEGSRPTLTEPECRARLDRSRAFLRGGSEPRAQGPTDSAEQKGEAPRGVVAAQPDALEVDATAEITGVETLSAQDSARVVVKVTRPTRFELGVLDEDSAGGPRLYVDVHGALYQGQRVFEETGLVSRVRLGHRAGGTRLVLDLRRAAYHRVFYLPHPFRLIIDLSVTAPERLTIPREIRRVVLDPGHGGHDPGAVGPSGLREKDVTLDIAHRAAPLLAREVGVSTLLTRDVDVYVPLDERAARANAFNADLFISIHMNSSPDGAARGVMTFVLDSSRHESEAQVAARENASTAAAAAELANSLSGIESSSLRAASQLFAELLQRAAGASLRQLYPDVEDHGVQRAGFYVLAGATMPAVLFEGSFISNPVESRRLSSEAYRQRLADALVNAVRAYKEGRH